MISQKAKYALRALVALARLERGAAMTIGEIAEAQSIPKKFLEQKRARIVESKRGKSGGYGLFRPAEMISFGEVLRLIDGPIAPLPCLSKVAYRRCADCGDESGCEIRRVFARVADSSRAVLDGTMIADAIDLAKGPAGQAIEP